MYGNRGEDTEEENFSNETTQPTTIGGREQPNEVINGKSMPELMEEYFIPKEDTEQVAI